MVLILCISIILGLLPGFSVAAKAAETELDTAGDVDGDGSVTPKDVTMLRRYLAGGWGVNVDEEDADVDGDGKVTPKDVTMLRRYLAGGWNVTLSGKDVDERKGWFKAGYGSVTYVINEYDEQGNIIKAYNYRLGSDSGRDDYVYDAHGHSYTVRDGRFNNYLYDENDIYIGWYEGFLDKKLCGFNWEKTETSGNITLRTGSYFLRDGSIDWTEVDEYDNTYITKDDPFGRLLKSTTTYGDGRINYSESKYGSDGKLSERVSYDEDGNITGVREYTYSADGKTETQTYKDKEGNVAEEYIYEYDENGNTLRYSYTSKNNSYSHEYEYYANGKTKKSIEKDAKGEVSSVTEYDDKERQVRVNSSAYTDYDYEYDDKTGKASITTVDHYNNDWKTETEYSFNEKRHKMQAKHFDEKGNVSYYEIGEYDENAKLIKLTKLDPDRNIISTSEYTYNTVGQIIEQINKDEDAQEDYYYFISSIEYKYNEYGQQLEIISYSLSGDIRKSQKYEYYDNGRIKKSVNKYSWGYSYYEYDENGWFIESGDMDNDGNKTSYTKYVHDEKGNTIKTIKYNDGIITETVQEDGKSTESVETDTDGNVVSRTKYEYNEDGKITKETKTDKDGAIISTADYTYDSNGNETGYVCEYADGSKDTQEHSYYANGNTEYYRSVSRDGTNEEGYYYENGNNKLRVYNYSDGSSRRHEYYENGYSKLEIYIGEDGSKQQSEYNEDGNETLYVANDKEGSEKERRETKYNDDGKEISYFRYVEGKLDYSKTNEYHENGKLAESVTAYNSGEKYVYKYNDKEQQISYVAYDKDGKETYSSAYTYDENNKQKSYIYKQSDGSSTEHYYKDGNTIKIICKNADGNIYAVYSDYTYDAKNRATGYKQTRYNPNTGEAESVTTYFKEYYDSGNVKTEKEVLLDGTSEVYTYLDDYREICSSAIYYDSQNNMTSSYVYEYDEKGKKIGEKHTLSDGNVENIAYEYDADGWQIKETHTYSDVREKDDRVDYIEWVRDGGNSTSSRKVYKNGNIDEFYYGVKKVKIVGIDYSIYPYFSGQAGGYYSSYLNDTEFGKNDLTQADGDVKYLKLEINYDEDGYVGSAIYILDKDKNEKLYVTITHDFNDGGMINRTVWKYTDGRTKRWTWSEAGDEYYEYRAADGTLLDECIINP